MISIVIGSWGSYNECNERALGSKWLDLSDYSDWEEIEEALKKQGFELDGIDEELFIQDVDGIPNNSCNWDYVNPQQLFETLLESGILDDDDLYELFEAYLEVNSFDNWENLVSSYGSHWHNDINLYSNQDIIPAFGDKHLDEITRADIQNYLSALVDKEKYRTAEKLKVQLKAIFDVAVADYNFKSPMTKVEVTKYEVKKGNSLSLLEEKTVVDYCILHREEPVCSAILILLYSGMRVGELVSAVLHENYIECETEKIRKGKAKEIRKIPISPMLKRVMQYIDFEAAKTVKRDYINRRFQKIIQGRHTHELR